MIEVDDYLAQIENDGLRDTGHADICRQSLYLYWVLLISAGNFAAGM